MLLQKDQLAALHLIQMDEIMGKRQAQRSVAGQGIDSVALHRFLLSVSGCPVIGQLGFVGSLFSG
ncbi:MAG: hypothetical protein JSV68_10660 [Anaerolineaceae bacterium]|nr:MAG: hypothetical protein JSV68_10660 [Anaerolineaceae bacterium]